MDKKSPSKPIMYRRRAQVFCRIVFFLSFLWFENWKRREKHTRNVDFLFWFRLHDYYRIHRHSTKQPKGSDRAREWIWKGSKLINYYTFSHKKNYTEHTESNLFAFKHRDSANSERTNKVHVMPMNCCFFSFHFISDATHNTEHIRDVTPLFLLDVRGNSYYRIFLFYFIRNSATGFFPLS